MTAPSILCFGEALIDFHTQPSADPHAPPAFVPYTGGAPANVAVAVAKLGGNAGFIGMIATDMFGNMLMRSLEAHGVDTRYVARTESAPTALAFVSHDDTGERSFSFYRPPSADLLFAESDFDTRAFDQAGVFHACSNCLTEPPIAAATLAGMALARQRGALVSFDMNLRPALWAKGADPAPPIWACLKSADVVKLSQDELDFLSAPLGSEDAVLARLWQGHARWLVVTDGAAAIRWFAPDSRGSQQAFKLPAVDTTGAGDAFIGGLLYGLAEAQIRASDLPQLSRDETQSARLLRLAAACGALAVTRRGSFDAMPTLAQVHEHLRSAGYAQDLG